MSLGTVSHVRHKRSQSHEAASDSETSRLVSEVTIVWCEQERAAPTSGPVHELGLLICFLWAAGHPLQAPDSGVGLIILYCVLSTVILHSVLVPLGFAHVNSIL